MGHVLFATRSGGGVVGIDCLLDVNGSAVGVPVHVMWELPHDARVAAWQLSLVESWLSDDKPVGVVLRITSSRSQVRFTCEDTTLLVDTPERQHPTSGS